MARLSQDSPWMMQQNDGLVELFHEHTEEVLVQFNPSDANGCAQAQHTIHLLGQLTDEEKCFGHFWSGYFYAHGGGGAPG